MSLPALSRPLSPSGGLGNTQRTDGWWMQPVGFDLLFVLFSAYAFWAMILSQGEYFEFGPYLSPFYSPNLEAMFPDAFTGLGFSPVFLILIIPLGFRATCYYFRKVYYRTVFASPAACAVDKAQTTGYQGETQFPFIFQNAHRYFLYLAIALAIFHWFHAWEAMWFEGGWGIHVGTAIMWIDALFLTLYVTSCHSFRHLIGGKEDCFDSCGLTGKAWKKQSKLNEHHGFYGWASLFTIALADLYVRLCAMGVVTDITIFGN